MKTPEVLRESNVNSAMTNFCINFTLINTLKMKTISNFKNQTLFN